MNCGLFQEEQEKEATREAMSNTDIVTRIKVTEKQFLRDIVGLAKLRGWLVYHTWNSVHSAGGFPDLVLVRPHFLTAGGFYIEPRIIFAEVKSDAGKVKPEQELWLEALKGVARDWGFFRVFLWRPKDWLQIVEALE